MCMDMYIDMCMDMCMYMCRDRCTDMRTDMCTDRCKDMCTDMCVDMSAPVERVEGVRRVPARVERRPRFVPVRVHAARDASAEATMVRRAAAGLGRAAQHL